MTLNEQGLLALLLTWQGEKIPHNPQVCRFKSFDSQCMFMHRIDRNDTPINTSLPSSKNALTCKILIWQLSSNLSASVGSTDYFTSTFADGLDNTNTKRYGDAGPLFTFLCFHGQPPFKRRQSSAAACDSGWLTHSSSQERQISPSSGGKPKPLVGYFLCKVHGLNFSVIR